MPETVEVCAVSELPPGAVRLVEWRDRKSACSTAPARVYAIEDRCSHDDGPLVEGELDERECTIECPRHGSKFDLRTGRPKSLPAYEPVDTFAVVIDNEMIKLEVA